MAEYKAVSCDNSDIRLYIRRMRRVKYRSERRLAAVLAVLAALFLAYSQAMSGKIIDVSRTREIVLEKPGTREPDLYRVRVNLAKGEITITHESNGH